MQFVHESPMKVAKELAQKLGGYNDWPPNVVRITDSDLALWITNTPIRFMDSRQVSTETPSREPRSRLILFVASDLSGVLMESGYHPDGAPWTGYFSFTYCIHKFKVKDTDGCYEASVCTLCGVRSEIDSSG